MPFAFITCSRSTTFVWNGVVSVSVVWQSHVDLSDESLVASGEAANRNDSWNPRWWEWNHVAEEYSTPPRGITAVYHAKESS